MTRIPQKGRDMNRRTTSDMDEVSITNREFTNVDHGHDNPIDGGMKEGCDSEVGYRIVISPPVWRWYRLGSLRR